MTTMGQGGLGGGSSQAGAFQECQQVYSSVLNMCQATKLGAAQPTGQRPVTPAPKPAPQQPTHQQSARPADGSSRSVSPDPNEARKQQLLSQMPAQCRNELNALFQGADTGDRAKALTAYDSLRGQQCNGAMQTLAGTTGLGMPERVMTPRSQRLVDRAMAGDEGIVPGRAADAAAQGGGSYDIGQILDFGIALLGAMNGVAGVYVPSAGGAYASRMGSIGNRAVHSTYGQGAPIRPAPRTGPSDITGTK